MAVERGNYLSRHISDTEFHGLPLAQQEFRKLWHRLQEVFYWDSRLDSTKRGTMNDVLLAIARKKIPFGNPVETNDGKGKPCTLFLCPEYQTTEGSVRVKVELFPRSANHDAYNPYPQIGMIVKSNEGIIRMAIAAEPKSGHSVAVPFFISQNPHEDLFADKNRISSFYSFKTGWEFEAVISAFKNYLCSSGNSAKIREALTLAG